MAAVGARIPEALLVVYRVGSADKVYSEVSQRELRLRHDPDLGPLLRADLPVRPHPPGERLAIMLASA